MKEISKEYWCNVELIFNQAISIPPKDRENYVSSIEGINSSLKNDVLALLESEYNSEFLLSDPAYKLCFEIIVSEPQRLINEGQFAQYKLLKILGQGGTSTVFLARDKNLGRLVAIKVFHKISLEDPVAVKRFKREARTALSLVHPNLVHIYSFGWENDYFYLAMEYVQGQTLRELIVENKLDLKQKIETTIQVARALDVIHGKGFIHRDVKPENIMVMADGSVKLLDLGLVKSFIAKQNPAESENTLLTTENVLMGTTAYMSPEQIKQTSVDNRTDLWSLGIVLYELLFGKRPFGGESPIDLQSAIILKDLKIESSEIKKSQLTKVLTLLLEKDPADRYQNAADVINDLKLFYRKNFSTFSGKKPKYTFEAIKKRNGVSLNYLSSAFTYVKRVIYK